MAENRKKDGQYYKYLRLRDGYGDVKGATDILDFPVIQKDDLPEYDVFMDVMEENFKGRKLLALQEYAEGIVSPMGQPLKEYRTAQIQSGANLEDFINPLDEPSRALSFRYQADHVYLYKDAGELRLVRMSSHKAEGSIAVRETLYDITDVPAGELKVLESSVSKDYLDLECAQNIKDMLARNHCSLGDKVEALYKDRTREVLTPDSVKDIYLPENLQDSMQKLDMVMVSPQDSSAVMDAAAKSYLTVIDKPVTVYLESEYWLTAKSGEDVAQAFVGTDIQAVTYDMFSRGTKAFWNPGDDMAMGMKNGDAASRGISVDKKATCTLPDGTEVTMLKVTTARALPLTKTTRANVERLQQCIGFSGGNRRLSDLRNVSGFASRQELFDAIWAAKPFIVAQAQGVKQMQERINELFPQKKLTFAKDLFMTYVKERKILIDKKLLAVLDKVDFRKGYQEQALVKRTSFGKKTGIQDVHQR